MLSNIGLDVSFLEDKPADIAAVLPSTSNKPRMPLAITDMMTDYVANMAELGRSMLKSSLHKNFL